MELYTYGSSRDFEREIWRLGKTAERWAWQIGLRAQLEDSITRGNIKLHIEDKLTGEVDIIDFYLLFNFKSQMNHYFIKLHCGPMSFSHNISNQVYLSSHHKS